MIMQLKLYPAIPCNTFHPCSPKTWKSAVYWCFSSVQFSHSVVSDSLQCHELQHTRPPCSSPTPRVHPNPCPSSWWYHPTTSSSVIPFSSCPQSFSASGSFLVSWLFTSSGGQSIGALASVLPMNIQGWSPFSIVQSLSHVRLFGTPWTAARQASLSITNSQSQPKPMTIELVMPFNHLILCRPLLLLPSIFLSIRVFSNKSALHISGKSIGVSASTSVFQWTPRTDLL